MLASIERLFFNTSARKQQLLLVVLGGICYFPFIGEVHLFDWDEINFAEISREMMLTGDYFRSQIDFTSFYEKPPLFNWMQILSFRTFGMSEFGARFPNALFGIFSLLLIFNIGKTVRNKTFGMLWALLYIGSFLPHFYFKTGVIDPVFNFFIFASLYLFIKAYTTNSNQLFFIAGLINGLSVITKGPVGLLILLLTVIAYQLLYDRTFSWQRAKQYFMLSLGVLGVALLWLLPQFILEGTSFIVNFTNYMIELLTQDVATHGQPFYYHFVVLFIGCFPISIFALSSVVSRQRKSLEFTKWMFVLFWVVLLLFSSVTTKIIHYSSMCYFPLAYLATDALFRFKQTKKVPYSCLTLYLALGSILAILFAGAPVLISFYKPWIVALSAEDIFVTELIKLLDISPLAMLWGLLFLLGLVLTFLFLRRGQIYQSMIIHTLVFASFFNGMLYMILPTAEGAVQGAAISFYKRLQHKDVHLTTIGFKSYGKLYYAQKTQQAPIADSNLLTDVFTKPVYFVTRIDFQPPLSQQYDNIKLVEQQGNFVLYTKEPKK